MVEECAEEFASIGIELEVIPFVDLGDWAINNHRKPQIIKQNWHSDEPVCWIDGDLRPNPEFPTSAFEREFEWIETCLERADVILEHRPCEPFFQTYISGFMVFSPGARGFLNSWCEKSDTAIDLWVNDEKHIKDESPDLYEHGIDQETLYYTIGEETPETRFLFFPDGYNDRNCSDDSIWWHLPASRTMKEVINSGKK